MRPKDDRGAPLAPPHKRLTAAPQLRQVGALALAQDSRSAIWTTTRKVAVLNRVIDHIVDGDAVPKWVYAKDCDRPDNRCLVELWTIAVNAVRAALASDVAA